MKLEHRFLLSEGLLVIGLIFAMDGNEMMTYVITAVSVMLVLRTFGKKRVEEDQFSIACVCLIDIVLMGLVGFYPQMQALIPLTYASAMAAYGYQHGRYRCLKVVKQLHLVLHCVFVICALMVPVDLSMKMIAFTMVMILFTPMSVLIVNRKMMHHAKSITHSEKVISVVE